MNRLNRFHILLFTAALIISAALCWHSGLRRPARAAQPPVIEDAFLNAISQAIAAPDDCEAVLGRIKRITEKAVKQHMEAQ